MAMYWGSKYISVTPADPAECHVEMVDYKPAPIHGSAVTEQTFLPVSEHLEQYLLHDTEQSAKAEVKRHIFEITHHKIVERAACIANVSLQQERLRFEKTGKWKERIDELKRIETKVKAEIRELKSIRRRKIETL